MISIKLDMNTWETELLMLNSNNCMQIEVFSLDSNTWNCLTVWKQVINIK